MAYNTIAYNTAAYTVYSKLYNTTAYSMMTYYTSQCQKLKDITRHMRFSVTFIYQYFNLDMTNKM